MDLDFYFITFFVIVSLLSILVFKIIKTNYNLDIYRTYKVPNDRFKLLSILLLFTTFIQFTCSGWFFSVDGSISEILIAYVDFWFKGMDQLLEKFDFDTFFWTFRLNLTILILLVPVFMALVNFRMTFIKPSLAWFYFTGISPLLWINFIINIKRGVRFDPLYKFAWICIFAVVVITAYTLYKEYKERNKVEESKDQEKGRLGEDSGND